MFRVRNCFFRSKSLNLIGNIYHLYDFDRFFRSTHEERKKNTLLINNLTKVKFFKNKKEYLIK